MGSKDKWAGIVRVTHTHTCPYVPSWMERWTDNPESLVFCSAFFSAVRDLPSEIAIRSALRAGWLLLDYTGIYLPTNLCHTKALPNVFHVGYDDEELK